MSNLQFFTIQFLTGKFRIPEEMSGKFEISEKHSEFFFNSQDKSK